MEGSNRLKIKVGPHEFDAEGPPEVVQAQFDLFRQLVTTVPLAMPEPLPKQKITTNNGSGDSAKLDTAMVDSSLDKIMKVDDRIVSFTVPPKTPDDALLLLLYGQKILRANDSVTGGEAMEGLTATGGFPISRVDRLLLRAASSGDVIVIGVHRAKRYRLTNTGLAKARQIAGELISTVP